MDLKASGWKRDGNNISYRVLSETTKKEKDRERVRKSESKRERSEKEKRD